LSFDSSGDLVVQTYADSTLTTLTGSTTLIGFTFVQMNDSEITIAPTSTGEDLTISAGGLLQLAGATPSNDAIVFSPGGGELPSRAARRCGERSKVSRPPTRSTWPAFNTMNPRRAIPSPKSGATDVYDVTVKEGSSTSSLQFEQSTPVAENEFSLKPDSGTGTNSRQLAIASKPAS
jgi:hypothetical protein